MRTRALLIPLLYACATAQAGDFKLYAVLTEDTRVELSDGAVWQMDKGDVFPPERRGAATGTVAPVPLRRRSSASRRSGGGSAKDTTTKPMSHSRIKRPARS